MEPTRMVPFLCPDRTGMLWTSPWAVPVPSRDWVCPTSLLRLQCLHYIFARLACWDAWEDSQRLSLLLAPSRAKPESWKAHLNPGDTLLVSEQER